MPKLRCPDRRQVRMRERVRVDLPARPDQLTHVTRHEVPDLEIQDSFPTVRAEDRHGDGVVAAIAVVEGKHDRSRRQRRSPAPVGEYAVERDGLVPVRRKPPDLRGEVRRPDVQLGIGRAGRRDCQHVIHQDRHRPIVWAFGHNRRSRLRPICRCSRGRRPLRLATAPCGQKGRGAGGSRDEQGEDRDRESPAAPPRRSRFASHR